MHWAEKAIVISKPKEPTWQWECWGCLDETEHIQVDDNLVCVICKTENAHLDCDQTSTSYHWVTTEHSCAHEDYRFVNNGPAAWGYWECETCGEVTVKQDVDEEVEDGYVTRTAYPVWD